MRRWRGVLCPPAAVLPEPRLSCCKAVLSVPPLGCMCGVCALRTCMHMTVTAHDPAQCSLWGATRRAGHVMQPLLQCKQQHTALQQRS